MTHTTPADHDPHLLGAEDPAELLAETRLSLGETPTDCLLLIGLGEAGASTMITRSPLRDLLGPCGEDGLDRHLALMHERGSSAVRALIVLGDGHQELLAPVIEEILYRAGALLHAADRALGDRAGFLLAVDGAAAGSCWSLRRLPGRTDGAGLSVTRTGPLREFADTRAAAAAVLRGRLLPLPEAHAAALRELGEELELTSTDLGSTVDPGRQFALARRALVPLLEEPGSLSETDRMTKCEQVGALLSAVAVDRLHWELLAQCVEHGASRRIDRETLLQQLVSDRGWIPHEDVRAGGQWYLGLERMRTVAAGARAAGSPAQRSTARSAWRALTALLVLLAWWNHRFATAGDLVDELREEEPGSTLAPLLSRMTDTPIFPAWWPDA